MSEYLTTLRKKPKHVRDNIAFGVAGGSTVFIALLWFLVGSPGLSSTNISTNENPKAFSTFFEQMKEQVAGVSGAIPETAPTPTTETPGTTEYASASTSASQTLPQEATIMVVPSASTSVQGGTPTTSPSVLY